MKQFLVFVYVFICLSTHTIGQNITADLFLQPANTGANMTVAINASSMDLYEGGQIGAFYDLNGDGALQCVGVQTITTGFFGLALWGDDSFTTETDGLSSGAVPQFAILFDGNVIPFNESPQFTGYVTNGIFSITDTDLPSQDYSSCEQSEWFLPFEGNTGANMTLLLQESFVSSMNTQTNNAYLIAATETGLVVGSTNVNNVQTSMAIWGDDSFTTEIDGATDGQLINFYLIDGTQLFDINYSTNYITNDVDVFIDAVVPVLICTAENLGCTDESACNFNAEAIIENGSCTYSETYFDCNGNCINDSDADDICDELEVSGCTNPNASNYNNIATDDDGTCIFLGCTDQEACNWDAEANSDDGSCIYVEMYYNCDGNCINDTDQDEVCDEEDNCIEVINPNQEDIDNDGEGDVCDYNDGIGIDEITENSPNLIKMIDVLGREYKEHKIGMLLFYIYDNGKVEKRVIH